MHKNKYLYRYNSMPHNNELAHYEMEQIFNQKLTSNLIFSEVNINPNKSYFLNYQIEILFSDTDLSKLIAQIKAANLYYEEYKIEFIDVDDQTMVYKERIQTCIDIAWSIEGTGTMHQPQVTLVVTNVNGTWYFGQLLKNDRQYLNNRVKPHSYSNAMTSELSRTLVNIAIGQDPSKAIIDPCCGIGTVVIEALSQGLNITGSELNYEVAIKAQENVFSLDLPNVIKHQDMHTITQSYDVAIMDLPYGLFSITSLELQTALVRKCYDFAKRLVLVANELSETMIAETNWKVTHRLNVPKKGNGKFERFIYILDK